MAQNEKETSHKIHQKLWEKKFWILGISFGVLILVYFASAFFYSSHFIAGTTINGVDCSNLTAKQAEDKISDEVRNYTLTLKERNDQEEEISGEDFDLSVVFDTSLSELKEKQNNFLWMFASKNEKEITVDTMLDYDEDLLENYFDNLECFQEDNIVAPVSATLSEYSSDSGYTIIPEELGTTVLKDDLYTKVKDAVNDLTDEIDLDKEDLYENPTYTSESEEVTAALDLANTYASTDITYQFGDDKEELDGSTISGWISVSDDMTVTLDETQVQAYVRNLAYVYNTCYGTRTITSSYGTEVTVSGGAYGWKIAEGTETTNLVAAIEAGTVEDDRTPEYSSTAAQYGDDDVGDTYAEVNLTRQHMFYYKDGELKVDCDIVSGDVSNGTETKQGTWGILYKETDASLVGEDYDVPVAYWMPFDTNVGFHPATWRDGNFGGDIYLTDGSHGCVNMPSDAAATLYENISVGDPVYVYEE